MEILQSICYKQGIKHEHETIEGAGITMEKEVATWVALRFCQSSSTTYSYYIRFSKSPSKIYEYHNPQGKRSPTASSLIACAHDVLGPIQKRQGGKVCTQR